MATELLQYILGCGIFDIQRAEELISEYNLPTEEIAELIRDELIFHQKTDPVGAVFKYVQNQLPSTAEVELYPNYLATQMYVRIPKEDFEELEPNLKAFLENECELTVLEEEVSTNS